MASSLLDGKRILAVDDEPDVLAILKDEIEASCSGCIFESATSYEEAARYLDSADYDVIILDIMGVRGFDLLEIAVKRNLKAVMFTAHALSPESLKRAYDMGARAYIPKNKLGEVVPFLEDTLKYAFEPGWKRAFELLGGIFTELWGPRWDKWEKVTGRKVSSGVD